MKRFWEGLGYAPGIFLILGISTALEAALVSLREKYAVAEQGSRAGM